MSNKYLSHAISWILQVFVYVLIGPFIFLHYAMLRCLIVSQIRSLRRKVDIRDLTTDSNANEPLTDVKCLDDKFLSDMESLDFKSNRSRSYAMQLTYGGLWEYARLASGQQKVSLVSNHVLYHVLFNSVFSHGLVKEDNPLSEVDWRFPFTGLNQYKLYQGFYWDVAEIMILKSGRINIRDRDGIIHTPRSKTWALAKAHVQSQLTFFAPGIFHDQRHFLFPSLIASEIRRKLPTTSILRQLLSPHARFSRYFGDGAFNESLPIEKSQSFTEKLFRPWMAMSIAKQDAKETEIKNNEKMSYEKIAISSKITDTVSYHAFLREYFSVFTKFVKELSPLLTSDYEILKPALEEHVTGISRENMTDVLAEFLWNSSVIHYSDHESYLQQWGRRYGCFAIRLPLVHPAQENKKNEVSTISKEVSSSDARKSRPDCVINVNNDVSKENGTVFFRPVDVCRTRCFLRAYVEYNETPNLDLTLFNTKYEFTNPLATTAAETFLTELHDLNSKLKQRGEALVNAEKFIRSVCF